MGNIYEMMHSRSVNLCRLEWSGKSNRHWLFRWRSCGDGQWDTPCSEQIGLYEECDVNWIWNRFGPYVHVQCVDGVPSFCYCCNFRPDIIIRDPLTSKSAHDVLGVLMVSWIHCQGLQFRSQGISNYDIDGKICSMWNELNLWWILWYVFESQPLVRQHWQHDIIDLRPPNVRFSTSILVIFKKYHEASAISHGRLPHLFLFLERETFPISSTSFLLRISRKLKSLSRWKVLVFNMWANKYIRMSLIDFKIREHMLSYPWCKCA